MYALSQDTNSQTASALGGTDLCWVHINVLKMQWGQGWVGAACLGAAPLSTGHQMQGRQAPSFFSAVKNEVPEADVSFLL